MSIVARPDAATGGASREGGASGTGASRSIGLIDTIHLCHAVTHGGTAWSYTWYPPARSRPTPLDVGPDSKLNLVDVIDRTQGAPFCAGICEVFPGAPVDFDYDDDAAVCYMLEGDITLSENGESQVVPARRRRLHSAQEGAARLLEHRLVRQVLLRHLSALAVGRRGDYGSPSIRTPRAVPRRSRRPARQRPGAARQVRLQRRSCDARWASSRPSPSPSASSRRPTASTHSSTTVSTSAARRG